MRILVTGALGQLGRALLDLVERRGWIPMGVDLEDFDIGDREATRAGIEMAGPDVVIHTAARTDVDGCEGDREAVFRVNAEGARNVTRACRSLEVPLYLVSTDFVFDGERQEPYPEDHPMNPLCLYGESKAAGEELACRTWPEGVRVVRTQWLYGPGGRHFVGAILRRARETGALRVVSDQVGCPTMTYDLAAALLDLVACQAAPGIYQASGSGSTSWHEFARAILEIAGLDRVSCEPITAASLDLPARRPAYSVMSKARLEAAIGRPMRPWREALAEYLLEMGGLDDHGSKD